MTNQGIRMKAMEKGVRLWEIAKRLGITEFHFSRMLREELPPEKQEAILRIIDEIADGRDRS